jgi:hypothetical protein
MKSRCMASTAYLSEGPLTNLSTKGDAAHPGRS